VSSTRLANREDEAFGCLVKIDGRMSAFGTKRTWNCRPAMSAFGGKADIDRQCFLKLLGQANLEFMGGGNSDVASTCGRLGPDALASGVKQTVHMITVGAIKSAFSRSPRALGLLTTRLRGAL
jgi:hypothetical protein